ncbi:MAG: DUF3800 domain-containing protein [Nanoarchaeota archaeon]
MYLDESGDLGFDFFGKKPSKYFTVTILVIKGIENNKALIRGVKKTLRNKIPRKQFELKGSKDSIKAKKYFYKQIRSIPFKIYSITLNKRRVYERLYEQKDRVYNFIARIVLDKIPVENISSRIELIIDKSKNAQALNEFSEYIKRHMKARIDPRIPLEIHHRMSHKEAGLQAVDSFAWGIFRKNEQNDYEWFNVFKEKVVYDEIYLRKDKRL